MSSSVWSYVWSVPASTAGLTYKRRQVLSGVCQSQLPVLRIRDVKFCLELCLECATLNCRSYILETSSSVWSYVWSMPASTAGLTYKRRQAMSVAVATSLSVEMCASCICCSVIKCVKLGGWLKNFKLQLQTKKNVTYTTLLRSKKLYRWLDC